LETFLEHFQLPEISKPASISSSKKSRDNKSFSTTLSIKSSRWKEKSPEHRVRDLKKSRRDSNRRSLQPKLSLINKRSNLICLLFLISNLLMRRETSRELSRRLDLKEALLRPKFKSLSSRMRWLPTI
jgi:hypothetical protein